ncbi:MAG TPA: bifunctional precorrin-2 dehydrogenase/sirohydrochlorin ferrochelatase [Polyangia bacterium]|nr:bifunctional precorrin-2 dehydrogenase/sirohydrochlorin ferrochelatase [Polyangia bacterium]
MSEARSNPLFPLFLKLEGRQVLVVGGGPVAAAKVGALLESGALVTVVSPELHPALIDFAKAGKIFTARRCYLASDLLGVWLVVAAAPPEVNQSVAAAAGSLRLFVLAVDDTSAASAYGAGTFRRGEITIAVSTNGRAPALAGLLREGLEAALPEDLGTWSEVAARERTAWQAERVPMPERRPRLLAALNRLYEERATGAKVRP